MATVTLFLCCLLGSVSLVYGQQISNSLDRLAASNEPDGTDHTGEIISFSDVGSGVGTDPRAWYCYTDPGGAVWQGPGGSDVPIVLNRAAVENELFISGVNNPDAVVLHRGPTHFSPDGEHCCARIEIGGVTVPVMEVVRRCVTFTPCPTLSPLTNSNGRISYDPDTNIATYGCVTGYTPTIISGTAQRTCQSDGTSAGTWTGTAATVTCARVSCGDPPPGTNASPGTPSSTLYQGAVTYTCVTGYRITTGVTTAMATCMANRMWETVPTCIIVDCGDLPNPTNGAVDTSSGTTFMTTATYTCNTGYTLIGANTRTCGGDGQWIPDAPPCLQFLAVISPSGIPMAGQSFSLTCSLSGGASLQPTLSYQWTREGGSLMTSTATLNFDTLYLSDAGQYSCQVILTSSQLEGEHTVAAHYTVEFMTLNIQLRLDGITNCEVYIEPGRTAIAGGITNRLSQGVEGLCACGFSPSLLTDEFINCFNGSSSHVTYRAVLTGTETASAVELISLIEQWISDTSSIIVQSTRLGLTNTCPVVITDRDSPECPEDITNRTQMATPTSFIATSSPTEGVVVNVGAVAGWVVAGVLAIAVLVLIVIVLVMWRQRRSGSKDMSEERTGSQPTQLPPVVMSHLPSHDFEELSKLQEEATYEVVDQPRPPPPADYQLSACAAYAPTDFNTENK